VNSTKTAPPRELSLGTAQGGPRLPRETRPLRRQRAPWRSRTLAQRSSVGSSLGGAGVGTGSAAAAHRTALALAVGSPHPAAASAAAPGSHRCVSHTAPANRASSTAMDVIAAGAEAPQLLVVVFHGLTGTGQYSAKDFASVVAAHPTARFLFPTSPKRAPVSDWNKDGKGGDWFLLEGRDNLEVIQECVQELDGWLDEQLALYNLDESALVLGGFSQGAGVAGYIGLSRGVAGVVLLGGIVNPRDQLLPASTTAKVLCVNGDADSFVNLEELRAAIAKYEPDFHVLEGVGHKVTDAHRDLVSAFVGSFE
jgi:predicted esterase